MSGVAVHCRVNGVKRKEGMHTTECTWRGRIERAVDTLVEL